jgi:hypothetical protein
MIDSSVCPGESASVSAMLGGRSSQGDFAAKKGY